MRICLARCARCVQHTRGPQHTPQVLECAQARNGRRDLPHHRARDRVEDPPRQDQARRFSIVESAAREPSLVSVRFDDELSPAQRVPRVGHRANVVSARIMP
jgi:hypothetical protein